MSKDKKYIIDDERLMSEWNWDKNNAIGFNPHKLTHGSNKKVWWQCRKGHEYESTPNRRSQGCGCPICAGRKTLIGFNDLAATHPELVKEWHPTQNGDLKPTMVSAWSRKRVWWQCCQGHTWQSRICDRIKGQGCPECARILNFLRGEGEPSTAKI